MSNPWFRMYSEFAFDPKVQVLTETLQRRYVMLLCLHCDGKLENRPDDEIALALRVTRDEWVASRDELIKRALLDEKTHIPSGWGKRQFVSDIKDPTAAERQARYRAKRRDERMNTVTSRSPDSDTDTEREESKYRFAGEIIRLSEKDYLEFQKSYSSIPDLNAELKAADSQYAKEPPGNWFCALGNRLNARHQQLLSKKLPAKPKVIRENVGVL